MFLLLRKSYITLIEIIVVITIIGLIAGALAYNMGGALDKGKATSTELTINKLKPILEVAIAEGRLSLEDVSTEWKAAIANDPLIDPAKISKDAWGNDFDVREEDGRVVIESKGLNNYNQSQGKQ